jgi:hypothetical protein
MTDSSQIVTFWLYLGDAPLMAVRLPAGATDEQVKAKAYAELDACPGVVCDGLEAPFERRHKIGLASVVRFGMTDLQASYDKAEETLANPSSTWAEKEAAWAVLGEMVGATDKLTPELLTEHLIFTGNAPKVEEPEEGGRAIAFIGGRIIAPKIEARPANAVFVISSISRQEIADQLGSCLDECRREDATVIAEEGATVTPSLLSDDFCRRYAECLANLTDEEEDAFLDLQVSGLAELGLVRREPVEG